MKICVPYTQLQTVTLVSLLPHTWTGYKIEIDDDVGYVNYWKDRWAEQETFISVEHDIGFWFGALESLWGCPHKWCGFGYGGEGADDVQVALGLVKFDRRFIEETPDMWDEWVVPQPHWACCDSWLWDYATERGYKVHRHEPPVINANPNKLPY